MNVQDIIKNRRIELGLTMKDVADYVGVSEGTVSRWESGNIANMKRNNIYLLSKKLNLPPTVILGIEEEESPDAEQSVEELNEVEEQLVTLLRQLPPEHQKMVPGILQSILDSLK